MFLLLSLSKVGITCQVHSPQTKTHTANNTQDCYHPDASATPQIQLLLNSHHRPLVLNCAL